MQNIPLTVTGLSLIFKSCLCCLAELLRNSSLRVASGVYGGYAAMLDECH